MEERPDRRGGEQSVPWRGRGLAIVQLDSVIIPGPGMATCGAAYSAPDLQSAPVVQVGCLCRQRHAGRF
jgi:hypothetical protein